MKVPGASTYNFENPVRRDTINIGQSASDNVTLRFYTDNTGPWFLHCHIDWHLEAGMAVVMAEDVPDIPNDVVPSSKPIDFYIARQGVLISSFRVLGPAMPGLVCLWTTVTRGQIS